MIMMAAMLCACALAECSETPVYPESAHPYAVNLTGDDENSYWEYTYPTEAAGLIVHFDSRTYIRHWDDTLTIEDAYDNSYSYTCRNYNTLAGSSLVLKGNSFTIRLVSDDSHYADSWGFAVTNVETLTEAQYDEIADSDFTISGSTITGYTGEDAHITIPSSLGGISITAIGNEAFYNGYGTSNTTLESVVISEGITSVGFSAFNSCTSLKEVTLPSTLEFIGAYAFEGCYTLEKTHIASLEDYLAISFGSADSNPVARGADHRKRCVLRLRES